MKKILCALLMVILAAGAAGAQELSLLTEKAPPLQVVQDGELTGMSVQAVREAMDRMGVEHGIQLMPWARAYRRLVHGPNVGLFSTTRTPQRESLFQWAGPLVTLNWTFYARKGRNITINSLDDARKVDGVGTYREDAREQYLEARGFENLKSVSRPELNVRKLMRDRIDLLAGTDLGIAQSARRAGVAMDKLEPVYVIRSFQLYLAFSKDVDPDVVKRWNEAFEAMRADGTFQRLRKRWVH
jgi:polar amino acid transport system substrate-binding protein